MEPLLITLKGLLSVIKTEKPITINLFDQDDLLLITFELAGYPALEDNLEASEVTEITFPKYNIINVKINKV